MKDENTLDQEERHAIRQWLNNGAEVRRRRCPFYVLSIERRDGQTTYCKTICKRMFPKIGNISDVFPELRPCPCERYDGSYVVRKARLVLARKGVLRHERKKKESKAKVDLG